MIGEGLPDGWTLDRVREVGHLRDPPRLLDLSTQVILDTPSGRSAVEPATIIDCGGLVVVLDGSDASWLKGMQLDDGSIICWGSYGDDLERALRGL